MTRELQERFWDLVRECWAFAVDCLRPLPKNHCRRCRRRLGISAWVVGDGSYICDACLRYKERAIRRYTP